MSTKPSAGDTIPEACRMIEVRVAELRQLFNAIDPSLFRERDLDPRAEEFIVDWSKDLPRDASLALVAHLDRAPGQQDEAPILRDGFLIIGWVAMWRPLEVFLYYWCRSVVKRGCMTD